jgi:hypothetical protein
MAAQHRNVAKESEKQYAKAKIWQRKWQYLAYNNHNNNERKYFSLK